MYVFSLILAASGLLHAASANPISAAANPLIRRQNAPSTNKVQWENPTGGNLQIGYADQGLKFGATKPSDLIRNQIGETCTSVGTCVGGNDVTANKSGIIEGGFYDTLDVSYNVDGAYPVDKRDGLLEMLAWAYDNQTTSQNVCYSPYATSSCNFMAYCPQPQKSCMDQYTAPGSVAVVLSGDMVDKNAAPGFISVQFNIKKEGDSGLCSELTTLGSGMSAFVGAAGGPAGGIFTLASLFCQS